ncbi:hypothetical protein IWQ61_008496 [Dispira simplex]|nr:hypothetical protein IWQ61_008496 [Dispira simplex]
MRLVNLEAGIWYDPTNGHSERSSSSNHPEDSKSEELTHMRWGKSTINYTETLWSNMSFGNGKIEANVRTVIKLPGDNKTLFCLGGLFGIGRSTQTPHRKTEVDLIFRSIWKLNPAKSLFIHVKLNPEKMHNPGEQYGELLLNLRPPVPVEIGGKRLQPAIFTVPLDSFHTLKEQVTIFVNNFPVMSNSMKIRFEVSLRSMYFPEKIANDINSQLRANRLYQKYPTRMLTKLSSKLPSQLSGSTAKLPTELTKMKVLYGNSDQFFNKHAVRIRIGSYDFPFTCHEYIIPPKDLGYASTEDSKFIVSGFAAHTEELQASHDEIVLGELFFRKYLTTFEVNETMRRIHITH